MGICIGVVIGCLAMNAVSQMALSAAQQVAPMARNPQAVAAVIGIFGTLAMLLFQAWITIGQAIVLLDIARGRDADFGEVFSGGRYIVRVVLAYILFVLMMMGLMALGAIPGALVWFAAGRDSAAGPIVLALGFIVGVIAAIILALRLSMFYLLIIDRDAGILDSLRLSYELTRGKAGMLFVIYLIAGFVNLLGVLACFIGLIFTLPYGALLPIVTYLALTGQATADPYSKGEPMVDLEPL
jgi:hypothetical protein